MDNTAKANEAFGETQAPIGLETLLKADYQDLSKAFGSRLGEAVRKSSTTRMSPGVLKDVLRALLDGLTPEPVDPMPEKFRSFMTKHSCITHNPDKVMQELWLTRIQERFVEADDWEQWPAEPLTSTIKTIDTGEYVPTMKAGDDYYFLNEAQGVLVNLEVDGYGEVSAYIYTVDFSNVNTVISEIERYVTTPDPYEGKVLRVDNDTIKILDVEAGELTPYPANVERAISWMTSIADETIRARLLKAGLPARAGLLLEGPPGSGKTTLARRIATDLEGQVTTIYATPQLDIAQLFQFSNRYQPVLLILEDVESFFGDRGSNSFSSFLNELDGMNQGAGKMILATSNDSSGFDEAIRRPGRLERRVIIDAVQPGAHATMLAQRLSEESEVVIEQLVDALHEKCAGKTITPAVVDSLARHALMLQLTGEALVAYAFSEWEPHYEGQSHIGDSAPTAGGSNPSQRVDHQAVVRRRRSR